MKLFAAIVMCLAGCATGYQPRGFTGGYSEMQMSSRVYQVTFEGNGYTSPSRARNYALKRAAHLAMSKHCKHFSVLGQDSTSDLLVVASKQPAVIDRPTQTLMVQLHCPGDPTPAPEAALDAGLIYSQVR